MLHVNLRFASGLFGTQTDGSGGPVGAPPRFVPRCWGFKRALVVFPAALTLMALVWFNGPVSAETVVGRGSSLSMTASGHLSGTEISNRQISQTPLYVKSDFTRGASVDNLTGYTLADLRLANAHFSPSLVPWSLKTAACESGFDDTKVGSAGEMGRMQIHPLWIDNTWAPEVQEIHRRIRALGYEPTRESLAVPEVNLTVASYIVNEYGPSLWTGSGGCERWS